jgi:hypothetical protein
MDNIFDNTDTQAQGGNDCATIHIDYTFNKEDIKGGKVNQC